MIRLERYRTWLLLAALFLLPWQTRWMFGFEPLSSGISEFGVLSLFAVEILIVASFILPARTIGIVQSGGQPFIKHRPEFDLTVVLGWLMVLAVLASVVVAPNTNLASMAWLHILVGYLLFLGLLNKHLKPQEALLAFALGLILPSLLGMYQAVAGVSPSSTWLGLAAHDAMTPGASVIETFSLRFLRAYGSFQHPNIFGGYLAVGLFAVFLFPRWYRSRRARLGAYAMGALFASTLVLTYSRSAWLAFALSFAITGWMLFTHHRVEMRRVIPLGLIILVMIFFTVTLFSNPIFTRFDATARLEAQSIEERFDGIEEWKRVVSGNVLEGVGAGNYTVALEETFPGREAYAYQPVHNTYLLIFSEVGIIGVLFILLWAASIDRYNYAQIPRVPAVGALAMGNAVLIIGFLDHYIWSLWPGLALLAFVMAMTLRLSEPGVEKE